VEARLEDAGQARLERAAVALILLRHGAGVYARAVSSLRCLPAALILFGVAACAQSPAPDGAHLWTVADLQALAAAQETTVASRSTFPGGIPLSRILDGSSLFQRPTVADGYGGHYVTTEVWTGYSQVWVQPMYVPVSGWNAGTPVVITDAVTHDWKPIFSVGPRSGFYSPFWEAVYFDAPAGTTADTYTSAKQVLDAGLPLHDGAGWTIPIVPDGLDWTLSAATRGTGWVNGAPVTTLNFGKGLFSWSEPDDVVDEVPLFVFVMRNQTGEFVAPGFRTVAGTGPLGSAGGPLVYAGKQALYSAYWRLYTVELPATAGVFADAALQAELLVDGLPPAPTVDAPVVAANPDLVGWVAVDASCFSDGGSVDPMDNNCRYLDSQRAIETYIPSGAIRATDVTVTCPFVSEQEYGGSSVPVVPVK